MQAGRILANRIEKGVVDIDRQLSVVVEAAEALSTITAHLVALELRQQAEKRKAEENMRKASAPR